MNWVDGAVLAAILVSGLIGWVRGLVREVLGIGAWALAAYVAFTWYDTAAPMARHYIGNPDIANPVAFGVIFVVALLVMSVVAGVIGRAVQGTVFSTVDGTLGLAFGLVRGAVVVAAAYIAGALLLPVDRWPPPVQDARSLPYIHDTAAWIASMVPPRYRPAVPLPQGGVTRATDLLQASPVGTALAAHPPAPRSAE